MEIEICASSRLSAEEAKSGGAHRIELCRQLELGGTTPTMGDVAYCINQLRLRTHVLVRPRGGNFCYSEEEFGGICEDVQRCRQLGAHAVVVGFLTSEGTIDEVRTRQVVQMAAPMEVTFHRAFDEVRQDPLEALESLIRCGCHRLLTSGCESSVEQGIPLVRRLVQQAGDRIIIMAGAGVTPNNAAHIIRETHVPEIHGSCKKMLEDGRIETDAAIVRQLLSAVSRIKETEKTY